MRFQELTIYSQYFRFILEDKPASYLSFRASVIYDNERQTVTCNCLNGASACEHKVFIHEMLEREKDETTLRYFEDCREETAQTITPETLNRIRGAFAREYNLAKGVVQYPERRLPLGWQGDVPGSSIPMRVIQRTPASFMVYALGSDAWKLVVGIGDPQCEGGKCRRGCKHEKAVIEAIRDWRAKGLLPKPEISGKTADTVIMDDLTMVEKAEPIYSTGKAEGRWITIPPGYDGTYTIGMTGRDDFEKKARERLEKAAREQVIQVITEFQRAIWDPPSVNSTASEYTVGIDPAKFREDINKAKELLENKEKPKPEKPKKPRTRFTDLEL